MMKIIENSTLNKKIKILIFISIFILLAIMFPFYNKNQEKPYSIFYIILTLGTFIWVIANIYSNFALKPYKIIGEVKFMNENIILLDNEIPINEIALFKFVYISYEGKSTSLNSFSITFGDKNILIIKTKNGEIFTYNLLLESKNDFNYIQMILSAYNEKGINIEFYRHNKLIFKS